MKLRRLVMISNRNYLRVIKPFKKTWSSSLILKKATKQYPGKITFNQYRHKKTELLIKMISSKKTVSVILRTVFNQTNSMMILQLLINLFLPLHHQKSNKKVLKKSESYNSHFRKHSKSHMKIVNKQ